MEILTIVFAAGIFAGFIDAIAGGGGLIMIPTLMMSGLSVGTAIATNKLCGTSGTLTSSFKFALDKNVDWQACFYMGAPAVFGSFVGSNLISFLPVKWAEPVVLFLLFIITIFIVLKPQFGVHVAHRKDSTKKQPSKQQIAMLSILGIIIGFHDGFFGPGAGTFFVFSLLSIRSLDFLRGTGSSKIINFLTNVTALASFLFLGLVDMPKGISGALGVTLGSFCGADFATKKGASVIRPLFIAVSLLLVGKLLIDLLYN